MTELERLTTRVKELEEENKKLKEQYEMLQNQLQEQNEPIIQEDSNMDKQNDYLSKMSKSFFLSPQMKNSEIKQAQSIIVELNELLKKVGITMKLTDDNLFTCFFNLYKMKKIVVRNEKGAKRKLPKTNKPFGEFLTYDEIKKMMKEKTAEHVAQEFGFTKMTLYRKLKQAKQREDKIFK